MIPAIATLSGNTKGRILRNNAPRGQSESVHKSGEISTYNYIFVVVHHTNNNSAEVTVG